MAGIEQLEIHSKVQCYQSLPGSCHPLVLELLRDESWLGQAADCASVYIVLHATLGQG